jgi:hypothetical protein
MRPRAAVAVLGALALLIGGCTGGRPYVLEAAGPFLYPAAVGPAFDRVAILVSVANRSGDDLQVNPADFVARDRQHRVYAANAAATVADARLAGQSPALRGISPLPTITLRADDVLNGFIVFEVPAGVLPSELVWRQSDSDVVAVLRPHR